MPLDFTAIDFETANSSNASACAVGLVRVRDGEIVDRTGWLIRPPAGHDVFFELNVRIHGIRPEDVVDAAPWSRQLADIVAFTGDDILVAHNAGFDMAVLKRACDTRTPTASVRASMSPAPTRRAASIMTCAQAMSEASGTLESWTQS